MGDANQVSRKKFFLLYWNIFLLYYLLKEFLHKKSLVKFLHKKPCVIYYSKFRTALEKVFYAQNVQSWFLRVSAFYDVK